MIARVWHGWTARRRADDYEALLRRTILPGIRAVKGYLGAHVLRRDDADEVEFVTVTYFESTEAVRAFAGPDHEKAVVSAQAERLLTRFDERTTLYTVAIRPEDVLGR